MRILMIAPQPFFAARGAPLCVYQHVKALVSLGHEVDLLTYPFGSQIDLPHVRVFRALRIPFLHNVKPGFSWAKFPLDLLLFFTALWRLCSRRYQYLHTHEEAAFMGVLLAKMFRCKHLYYMHCDLSQLVAENTLMARALAWLQKFMVRKAHAVLAFYPEVTALAKRIAPAKLVFTILPPPVDEDLPPARANDVAQLRQQLQLHGGPVLLYTGTFETYQGLDLLLQSIRQVQRAFPQVQYVIVGGHPKQVTYLRRLAEEVGVLDQVRIVGQRPLEEMPLYMALADILLSPRSRGTHVPLKVYTYLRSGKAILATDIRSHTQILTPAIAMLVPPTPEDLAQGAIALLQDPALAKSLGKQGQQFAHEHYSWPAFLEKCRQVYNEFFSTGY